MVRPTRRCGRFYRAGGASSPLRLCTVWKLSPASGGPLAALHLAPLAAAHTAGVGLGAVVGGDGAAVDGDKDVGIVRELLRSSAAEAGAVCASGGVETIVNS